MWRVAQSEARYYVRKLVDSLFQDVRFGLRILKRTPILTGAILIALTLGIGANTAMFSVVDAALLHPLRFPDPPRYALFGSLNHGEQSVTRQQRISSIGAKVLKASRNWRPGAPPPMYSLAPIAPSK
jgi:hypothetical protein